MLKKSFIEILWLYILGRDDTVAISAIAYISLLTYIYSMNERYLVWSLLQEEVEYIGHIIRIYSRVRNYYNWEPVRSMNNLHN
jgi:hypothetical protein